MSRKNSRLVTPVFTRYFEKKFDESGIQASSSESSEEYDEDGDDDGTYEEIDLEAAVKAFHRIVAQQSKVVNDSYLLHQTSKKEKNVRTVYMTQLSDLSSKNADALVAEEEKNRQKAEKKKEKKKKRKERKKEIKENDNTSSKTSRSGSWCNGDTASNPSKKDSDRSNKSQNVSKPACANSDENENVGNGDGDDEDEAFLDPNSAFVSKAVNKNRHKVSSSISRMEQTSNVGARKSAGVHDSAVGEGERLVREGYSLASREQYAEAVMCFSKAIRLVNNDHRFYSNRSFCYCQLEQYAKALKDAERSIELAPQNPKGYYRKAEALRGLKQYKQAETAYLKVLQLDEECEDAQQDIEDVKVLQLVEMGFDEDSSRRAIRRVHHLQNAIEELTMPQSPLNATVEPSIGDIYFSDDDENTGQRMSSRTTPGVKDIKMDPSNPEGLYSLWVGNITQGVKEKQILELFARYGAVQNVRLLPEKFCAFVNFRNQKAPGQAMKSLQGVEFAGTRLLIRFPDTPVATTSRPAGPSSSGQAKSYGPVNGDECYFWRTSGCAFGDKCRFRHAKENKGIDIKSWHKNR
ncbi:uncharacterized protein LOC134536833 [Bacillus rossius redtenbacheri]|uniref:uncharacterized protein LOC134536833 n=1 Tax=Bacillus rossius redtenbacheri TaxID=93214 RepID=UPI002FDCA430